MSEVDDILELACRLAREAGAIQRSHYETDFRIDSKSTAIDLVTEVDHACEAKIVAGLTRERPADAILAEEGSGEDSSDAAWRWIVDPLDGTVNFAHGYPCFCVSIGIEHRGVATVGVVYEPLRDELFHAVLGQGAFCNGKAIRVSQIAEMQRSLVCTGFAYDVHQSDRDNLNHLTAFVKSAGGVRRDGSAALDLCYVACGRYEGFWELKLHPWDVAAGALIVTEAGGRTSGVAGGPAPHDGSEIVASNGLIHDRMLSLLGS